MLRHKHSNSRGEGKPFTLTSVETLERYLSDVLPKLSFQS
jgi:hypothetical protein